MLNRKKIILKNGFAGFISQIISQVSQFAVRIFTLQYIGIEVMSIGATFTSVLQTLSLAELGFQTAIVYYLYMPLKNNDECKINQIMMVLKKVYEVIGLFFFAVSFMCIPFLKYILKDVQITEIIIIYYLIMCINITCTYFVSYKRALLFADQKEYISKFIDSAFNIVISILKIVAVIAFKNYALFLILQIIQTVGTNITIQIFCRGHYKYLKKCKFDFQLFKVISKDVKNVFVGKLAGYVYGATDNLVISSFVGTVFVGYLSNYTVFISAIKQVIGSVFNAMTPIIGNLLIEGKNIQNQEADFRMYSYVRYILASAIVLPWIILADDAVAILFGKQYILSNMIVVLLATDLYIHIIYTPCAEYISGSGSFAADKRISIIGAVINLVTSIIFVCKMGVEGVLVGTLMSQIYFWVGRSHTVYFNIFNLGQKEYFKYILKNIIWIIIVLGEIITISQIRNKISANHYILSVFLIFIFCELLNIFIQFILLHHSEEQVKLINLMKRYLRG